jgi:hypothetical protein
MFIILILHVDDILLASSNKNLLFETKGFLSSNFNMKDLGDASYVLGIEIHRDRTRAMLSLSTKAYIQKVLKGIIRMNVLLRLSCLRRVINLEYFNVQGIN